MFWAVTRIDRIVVEVGACGKVFDVIVRGLERRRRLGHGARKG